jgi:integrase
LSLDSATALAINEQRRAEAAAKNRVKHSGHPRVPHLVVVPRPLGPLTMRRIHNTLSAALKSATKGGLITRNPAPDAELPKGVAPKPKIWTAEQLGMFLDATEGQRTKPKTRAGEDRVVDLDAGSVKVLELWRETQDKERTDWGSAYNNPVDDDGPYNLVFTRENGAPLDPSQTYLTFVELVKAAGLSHLKFHGLRHMNISLQLEAGVSETVIAMRVGHTSPALIRSTYGHLIGTVASGPPRRPPRSCPARRRPTRKTTPPPSPRTTAPPEPWPRPARTPKTKIPNISPTISPENLSQSMDLIAENRL